MPKNKGKGGKNRRRGKNESDKLKRELIFKEAGQEYAKVERLLGNGRLEAYCFDGIKRLCHIRGKMRKKVWINNGDIILIGLRDFQDSKADVILKYLNEEARSLKSLGEIPDTVMLEEANDIEFDANAAIAGFDEASDASEDSDEEEADSSDEDSDEAAHTAKETLNRYRGEYVGVNDWKDSRRLRRK